MGGRRLSDYVGTNNVWLTAHHSLRCVRFNQEMGTNHPNEENRGEKDEKQVNRTNLGNCIGKRAGVAFLSSRLDGAGERASYI